MQECPAVLKHRFYCATTDTRLREIVPDLSEVGKGESDDDSRE
jgi:hypothetical protein